mmetsp:Transcript_15350/g.41523  ORF Transcript_15350/g.41523 Transcript_15350/m.41523 type:complete len:204 (+) Transcript_15350:3220-3831(+)
MGLHCPCSSSCSVPTTRRPPRCRSLIPLMPVLGAGAVFSPAAAAAEEGVWACWRSLLTVLVRVICPPKKILSSWGVATKVGRRTGGRRLYSKVVPGTLASLLAPKTCSSLWRCPCWYPSSAACSCSCSCCCTPSTPFSATSLCASWNACQNTLFRAVSTGSASPPVPPCTSPPFPRPGFPAAPSPLPCSACTMPESWPPVWLG